VENHEEGAHLSDESEILDGLRLRHEVVFRECKFAKRDHEAGLAVAAET